MIVFDVNTKKRLWEKYWPSNGADPTRARFSGDSQTVLVYAIAPMHIEALDARTGAVRDITRLPADTTSYNFSSFAQNAAKTRLQWLECVDLQAFQSPWLSWLQPGLPNGGHRRGVFASVVDSSTGRERLRLLLPDHNGISYLSADGSSLILYTWNDDNTGHRLRCWDVPSPPSWWWIGCAWLIISAGAVAMRGLLRRLCANSPGLTGRVHQPRASLPRATTAPFRPSSRWPTWCRPAKKRPW